MKDEPDHDLEYHDKKCEELITLQEKVGKWWHNLDHDYKIEIMENFYPDKSQLMDLDEMWNGLDWQDKLDIYNEAEGFEVRR